MTGTVLITGTSSGIGKCLAELFSEKGWNVIATMRTPTSEAGKSLSLLKNVFVEKLNVLDRESIDRAVASGIERFGGIDIVINNAGYGLAGPLEVVSLDQIQNQYATNVYGPILVMQAVLPHFRERKAGVIVNVSSIFGITAVPMHCMYIGTKHALEGISESAAMELEPFGIVVKLIEPGAVRTNFTGGSLDTPEKIKESPYSGMFTRAMKALDGNMERGSSAEYIAQLTFEAATDGTNRLRYLVGHDALLMADMRKETSDQEWRKSVMEHFKVIESGEA